MAMQRQPLTSSIGLLILRLGIAGFMVTHGWGKVQMLLQGQFEMFGDPIGIGSVPSLILIMLVEFIAALLVLVGLFTRWAAVPVVVAMTVAAFVAHANDPWTAGGAAALFFTDQTEFPVSREPALLFLTGFLALIFTGPGCFSIDGLRAWRRRTKDSAATGSAAATPPASPPLAPDQDERP